MRDGVSYENRYIITATRAEAYASPVMRALDAARVPFRMLPHKRVAKTVALAAAERQVAVDEMVKCILLRDKAGHFVLAALPGDAELRRAARARLRRRLRAPVLRVAAGNHRGLLGFLLGSVAPLPLARPIPVVVDNAVRTLAAAGRQVNISSGDPLLGLELAAADLIALLGENACFGVISRPAANDKGE